MKKTVSGLLCIILLFTSGCTGSRVPDSSSLTRYQAEFMSLFDTVTVIVGYSDSEENFKALAEEIRSLLEEYHKLYDIYHTYDGMNNIKTINDNAGVAPVPVDGRIIDLLKLARQQYNATDGAVNVAIGAVLKIWHDYRTAGLDDPENARLPPMEMLLEASQHTNIEDMIIDEQASTVYLKDPAMSLDVGAVAKGYATERVAAQLEARGVTSLLLSVGGNVRAVGEKPVPDSAGDRRWVIGIQNPDKTSSQSELMQVQISDLAVISSGSYERYYTVDGARYSHIIDPETLLPAAYYSDVTIIAPDSGLSDVLSTAAFVKPPEESRRFIETLDGVEALWVMPDGSIAYSDGFRDYVKAS